MFRSVKFNVIVASLLLQGAFYMTVSVQAEPKPKFFAIKKSIIGGLSAADAKITTQAIFGSNEFFDFDFEAKIFDDDETFEKAIEANLVVGGVAKTPVFLRMVDQGLPIEGAVFAATREEGPESIFVLLRKKGGPVLKSLKDIESNRLIVARSEGAGIEMYWLDTVLLEECGEKAESFFSSVEHKESAAKSVVPVFFGKADLCLIRRESWEVIGELNPQLITSLEVVAESEPMIGTVTFLNNESVKGDFKKRFTTGMFTMHQNPAGRSLLNITKVKRFFPFEDGKLDSVRALIQRHKTVTEAPTTEDPKE